MVAMPKAITRARLKLAGTGLVQVFFVAANTAFIAAYARSHMADGTQHTPRMAA